MARKKQVKDRIRQTIRERLDHLGMTARELARAVRQDASEREVDAWISGILKGSQGLSWKHFDAVADTLGMAPSDLVRYDDAELRELTPREMRLLRHYRDWPGEIQERWLAMLDHFSATVPDKDTARLLDHLRSTPRSLRRPVLNWLVRLLELGIPPEQLTEDALHGPVVVPDAPGTTRPRPPSKTTAAARRRAADQKSEEDE